MLKVHHTCGKKLRDGRILLYAWLVCGFHQLVLFFFQPQSLDLPGYCLYAQCHAKYYTHTSIIMKNYKLLNLTYYSLANCTINEALLCQTLGALASMPRAKASACVIALLYQYQNYRKSSSKFHRISQCEHGVQE